MNTSNKPDEESTFKLVNGIKIINKVIETIPPKEIKD